MVYDFTFPDVGEGITEGKLVKWSIKEGDAIAVDQTVAEVETDKSIVEIPSPKAGVVVKLFGAEGDDIKVGDVLVKIDESGEGAKTPEATAEKTEKVEPDVEKEETIVEPAKQEPKTPQSSAPSGALALPKTRALAREHNVDLSTITGSGPGGRITDEDVLGTTPSPVQKASEPEEIVKETEPAKEVVAPKSPGPAIAADQVLATPSVRKRARELGVDINTIKGTGDNGRITRGDLESGQKEEPKVEAPQPAKDPEAEAPVPKEEPVSTPPTQYLTEDKVVPMSSIRKAIAGHMTTALQKQAQVTYSDEIQLDKLMDVRSREKEKFKERGISLTYLPFFMKACVAALKKHPYLNATLDEDKQEIHLRSSYGIGFAVDAPGGLFVPVIKDVDRKSIADIATEIKELSLKARDAKLTPDDMKGDSFTISSVGSIGGGVFTPIINYPQVAILGVGQIKKKPIVVDEDVQVGHTAVFSLTFDHRVLDGAEAARFMATLTSLLEDPELLFMEMA